MLLLSRFEEEAPELLLAHLPHETDSALALMAVDPADLHILPFCNTITRIESNRTKPNQIKSNTRFDVEKSSPSPERESKLSQEEEETIPILSTLSSLLLAVPLPSFLPSTSQVTSLSYVVV